MLYTQKEFENLDDNGKGTAVSRYLHKIEKKETKKLLPHECEFICSFLPHIFADEKLIKPVHNIYELDFLAEPLFKKLMLIYLENLDFLKPVYIGHRNLEDDEIKRDKQKFYELLSNWSEKLDGNASDVYLHEVKLEYHRKLEILEIQFRQYYFGRRMYERRIMEQKVAAFYKYFITKSFFRNNRQNWVSFEMLGETILINAYSYVHIISRHYMPIFNGIDPEKSFNSELTIINPFDLPNSLRDLISDYFSHAPAGYNLDSEYMIFCQDRAFYIIWWKHKKLSELNHRMGYEVRTLYKIEAERDKQKINHNNFHQINNSIKYYY